MNKSDKSNTNITFHISYSFFVLNYVWPQVIGKSNNFGEKKCFQKIF